MQKNLIEAENIFPQSIWAPKKHNYVSLCILQSRLLW